MTEAAPCAADRRGRAAAVRFEVIDPLSPAAQLALGAYFAELNARFRAGFDPGSGGAEEDAATLRRPTGAFLLVRSGDDVIGCGGVLRIDERTGEIKRMWVRGDWRGLGLGRRLLARLEDEACALGRSRVVLDTNEVLTEAITMYERAGYVAIERYNDNPYAHRWFTKELTMHPYERER